MSLKLATVTLLSALAFGLPAAAQVSLGLLPVTLEGELDPSAAPAFADSIAASLQAHSITVVPAADLARAAAASEEALASCTTASCLGGVCERASVHGVVRAVVTGSLTMYTLRLEAIAPGGQRLAAGDRSCELCSQTEARTAMGELAAELGRDLPRQGAAAVSVTPASARLTVDGVPAAGGELRLGPGTHVLAASADGYRPLRREIDVTLGGETLVDLALERLTTTGVPGGRRRRLGTLGYLGIAFTTAGVLGTAASAAVIAVDGDCAGGRVDRNGQCELIYSTLAGGASGLAIGIVSVVAGVVMLVVDIVRRRNRRPEPSLPVDPDGSAEAGGL
jgi:hypothetical protein